MNLAQFFRDKQRWAFEVLGLTLPSFSIWDPLVPDSRVQDIKKRGTIRGKWGPMSFLYCARCHRRSGIASPETMLKVYYICPSCISESGTPANAIMVPGTNNI
jgi:hypothetical protein